MDTPLRADTRPARDAVELPQGWTRYSHGALPRPALTGAMLDDRFELMGRLGEGGTADLYLADDRLLRCKVAIKILRDDSPDSRLRFLRETEVLSNVHHENLVDVFARGVVQPGGMPYTVLRYLPGEDLKTRLLEGGPLPWVTVVEIGIQIAAVLMALHDAGVLHRDVKPENILWTHHTSRRVFVKLVDLGAARLSARFQGRQDRSYTPVCGRRGTAVGAAVGTPGYMPPEAGLREPDARTDVFALGVTLYQLCTGRMPDDPLTPTPVRAANPHAHILEDLERVIMSALHWNDDVRTPTAARLHGELSALRAVHADEAGLFDERIELREHLATGAEGEVFRAYHKKMRRPVALKRQLDGSRDNSDDRARFEREAWVLASVRHAGLPEVYDSGVVDGRAYTIMELCAGRPARRFCDDAHRADLAVTDPQRAGRDLNAARLRLDEVLSVGIQIAETMQAVHAIGVIHRDLSAQNVLIEAGREPRVKVIDFTGCLLTDRFFALRDEPRPDADLELTRDRALHTLAFAAPEVRADRRWSERSDVFALGVLLYRMLAGKMPYTPQARGTYLPLPRGHLGHAVDPVLEAMLLQDPAKRLSDMRAVAERLRDVLEDVTGFDVPPTRPQLALVPPQPAYDADAANSLADGAAGPAALIIEDAHTSAVHAGATVAVAPEDTSGAIEPASTGPAIAMTDAEADAAIGLATVAANADVDAGAGARPTRGIGQVLGAGSVALLAGLFAALLWTPSPTTPVATSLHTSSPAAVDLHASTFSGSTDPTLPPVAIPMAPLETATALPTTGDTIRRTDPPRLPQSTVKKLLARPIQSCDAGWLALTLQVANGAGSVEKINGFSPKTGASSVHRCVVDAVAAVRFPNASPTRLTVRFKTSTSAVVPAPGQPDSPVP